MTTTSDEKCGLLEGKMRAGPSSIFVGLPDQDAFELIHDLSARAAAAGFATLPLVEIKHEISGCLVGLCESIVVLYSRDPLGGHQFHWSNTNRIVGRFQPDEVYEHMAKTYGTRPPRPRWVLGTDWHVAVRPSGLVFTCEVLVIPGDQPGMSDLAKVFLGRFPSSKRKVAGGRGEGGAPGIELRPGLGLGFLGEENGRSI